MAGVGNTALGKGSSMEELVYTALDEELIAMELVPAPH
jgi:hypothetical protein